MSHGKREIVQLDPDRGSGGVLVLALMSRRRNEKLAVNSRPSAVGMHAEDVSIDD